MALDRAGGKPVVELDGALALDPANDIAEGRAVPRLSEASQTACRAAQGRLARIIAENRHVYGITTGFGPLADRVISTGDAVTLQQNLVHHLATGVGPAFDWETARAIVLARLAAVARGYSGASDAALGLLTGLLHSDLAPVIPERGTVGASGDLTPLAHLVLCLQGRGAFLRQDGTRIDPQAAFATLALPPLTLDQRDGLALVNGTSAMTGLALRNARLSRRLLDWAIALSAALAEVMRARAEAWDPRFAELRPHPGQRRTVAALQARLAGSTRLNTRPIALRRLDSAPAPPGGVAQDAYTLRCVPQVIGAVLDSLDWHDQVTRIELNAVTDNPILPEGDLPALHGGNFMGQHVGLVSDALATGLTVLAGLAERQIARVTDEKLNGGLPAFLHGGPAGLNSGLMGAQVTATALLAEMRMTGAASVQSISTNGANQDVVSMGTIAARSARDATHRLSEILAILGLAVAQGMDLCQRHGEDGFSDPAQALLRQIRAQSDVLDVDRPLGPEIETLALVLRSTAPAE